MPLVSFAYLVLLFYQFIFKQTLVATLMTLGVVFLNLVMPCFGQVGDQDLTAVVGNPTNVELLMSNKGQKEMGSRGDKRLWNTIF